MKDNEILDIDDVGEAIREGRPLRSARAFRILFAQDGLDFQPLNVADPVPLGRQILGTANLDARDGYSLFAILPTGDFEDVRLDEPFDLRGKGAERFVAFLTDRDFKLTLDEAQLAWGKPGISGAALYALGEVGDDKAVFLEVRGGEDRLIEPDDLVDLTKPGIERFITAARPPREIEIIVNARKRTITDPHVTFEQIVEIAFPGPHEPNVRFSMTYRNAASKPHKGELAAGGSVEAKNGTTFNVTRTVQS